MTDSGIRQCHVRRAPRPLRHHKGGKSSTLWFLLRAMSSAGSHPAASLKTAAAMGRITANKAAERWACSSRRALTFVHECSLGNECPRPPAGALHLYYGKKGE